MSLNNNCIYKFVCIVQVLFIFTVYNATDQSDKLKVC